MFVRIANREDIDQTVQFVLYVYTPIVDLWLFVHLFYEFMHLNRHIFSITILHCFTY